MERYPKDGEGADAIPVNTLTIGFEKCEVLSLLAVMGESMEDIRLLRRLYRILPLHKRRQRHRPAAAAGAAGSGGTSPRRHCRKLNREIDQPQGNRGQPSFFAKNKPTDRFGAHSICNAEIGGGNCSFRRVFDSMATVFRRDRNENAKN